MNVKKKKRHHQKVLGGRGTWKSAAPRGKTCACVCVRWVGIDRGRLKKEEVIVERVTKQGRGREGC